MANISRLTVRWDGLIGLPGYTNFHAVDPIGLADQLVTFFTAIRANFPSGLTWTIPASGDTFDAATGALSGSWSESGGGSVTASGEGEHIAPAGMVLNWLTAGINRGHRIRGRTFLVPLSRAAYDAQGSILTAAIGNVETAAETLRTSGPSQLSVWSRPRLGAGGVTAVVTGVHVPDLAAVLRSRRD